MYATQIHIHLVDSIVSHWCLLRTDTLPPHCHCCLPWNAHPASNLCIALYLVLNDIREWQGYTPGYTPDDLWSSSYLTTNWPIQSSSTERFEWVYLNLSPNRIHK
jgi:hypothetical protein